MSVKDALYSCRPHGRTGPDRTASGRPCAAPRRRLDALAANAGKSCGLVVLFKAPANAKRRLAGEIGDLAAEAAMHLWACALEDAMAWPGPAWFSPAAPRDREWLVSQLGAEAPMVSQRGDNLGERINHVDGELRRRGAEELLFVGADCPGLDAAYLARAAARLDRADAVLGPSRDGGVVLMGARRPWPDLRGLGWSSDRFCAELAGLCTGRGWSVAKLGVRADVDTVNDLLGAGEALSKDTRPARRGLARWLAAHRRALLTMAASHPW